MLVVYKLMEKDHRVDLTQVVPKVPHNVLSNVYKNYKNDVHTDEGRRGRFKNETLQRQDNPISSFIVEDQKHFLIEYQIFLGKRV